ncbi:hypothetical protein EMCRGX_G004925 [Ephydatia muelleri]
MYKTSKGGAGLAVSQPTAAAKFARLLAPPDGVTRGIDIFVGGPVLVVVGGYPSNPPTPTPLHASAVVITLTDCHNRGPGRSIPRANRGSTQPPRLARTSVTRATRWNLFFRSGRCPAWANHMQGDPGLKHVQRDACHELEPVSQIRTLVQIGLARFKGKPKGLHPSFRTPRVARV